MVFYTYVFLHSLVWVSHRHKSRFIRICIGNIWPFACNGTAWQVCDWWIVYLHHNCQKFHHTHTGAHTNIIVKSTSLVESYNRQSSEQRINEAKKKPLKKRRKKAKKHTNETRHTEWDLHTDTHVQCNTTLILNSFGIASTFVLFYLFSRHRARVCVCGVCAYVFLSV